MYIISSFYNLLLNINNNFIYYCYNFITLLSPFGLYNTKKENMKSDENIKSDENMKYDENMKSNENKESDKNIKSKNIVVCKSDIINKHIENYENLSFPDNKITRNYNSINNIKEYKKNSNIKELINKFNNNSNKENQISKSFSTI